ncbi:hypothetical protein JYU18_01280, partial [bacterium AH-315-E07]|nr:hypothetical protein [bacterium AH-315-E07]
MQNANTSELIAKLDMARAVLANPHLHIDEYGSGLNAAYKLLCDAQMIAPDNHIITSEINKLRQLSDEENNQTPNIFTFIYKNREIKIIGSNEDHIFKTICATRNYYELSMLEYIATLNIKGNMIDVGANIGNHSIFLSLLDGVKNVFCYEPSKQIYDVLKKNIQLNN